MSKRNDGHAWGKYTLEFKREAVRLVAGAQANLISGYGASYCSMVVHKICL